MGLQLIEEIKNEIKVLMRAGLSTKLSAVASRYSDSVALTAPQNEDYYDSITDPILNSLGFPAVFIVGGASVNNDVDGMRGGFLGAEMSFSHTILVVVVVNSSDIDELTKKLQRYAIAVAELLCKPGNITAGQCTLLRVMYDSPIYSDRGTGDLVQDIPIEFRIDSIETFD